MSHPKYSLRLFMPKNGKMRVPTVLLTLRPFEKCPSCDSPRDELTKTSIKFSCGMMQTLTDSDEFAVISVCPYAMQAVQDLKTTRLSRPGMPATLMAFSPDEFKLGDNVKWVSQSAGRETVKKGKIVAVVPPDARPEEYIPDGMRRNSTTGYGRSRSHVTYLVKVHGKGSMVYWPRVHVLEKQ